MRTAEAFNTFEVMREMFPKCYYCAASIRTTRFGDLVKIADKNRLAHRDCLAAEADEAAD